MSVGSDEINFLIIPDIKLFDKSLAIICLIFSYIQHYHIYKWLIYLYTKHCFKQINSLMHAYIAHIYFIQIYLEPVAKPP